MTQIKYVQLEPDAFLSDIDFQLMTAEERGCYWTIILYLYRNNGKLKYDPKSLPDLCKVKSEFALNKVLSKFQKRHGYLTHKRVNKEIQKAQVKQQSAVKAINTRWEKQRKTDTDVLPEYYECKPAVILTKPNPTKLNLNNNNNTKITNNLKQNESQNGGVVIVKKAEEILELDLLIQKKRTICLGELAKLFILNPREQTTFSAILKFLTEQCQAGIQQPEIFEDVVRWAKEAKKSSATNKKGLLVKKIKEKTGYCGNGWILDNSRTAI